MKTTRPGRVKYPRLYQTFETADAIGKVINRSKSYVHKALNTDFTPREWEMLENYAQRELKQREEMTA